MKPRETRGKILLAKLQLQIIATVLLFPTAAAFGIPCSSLPSDTFYHLPIFSQILSGDPQSKPASPGAAEGSYGAEGKVSPVGAGGVLALSHVLRIQSHEPESPPQAPCASMERVLLLETSSSSHIFGLLHLDGDEYELQLQGFLLLQHPPALSPPSGFLPPSGVGCRLQS